MTTPNDPVETIRRRMAPIALRLRLVDTLKLASQTLWIATTVFLLILLIGRFVPIAYLHWWAMIPLVLWVMMLPVAFLVLGTQPNRMARRIDQLLGLRERLSTALELHQRGRTDATPDDAYDLNTLQQADAAQTAIQMQARQIPWRIDRRLVLFALVPLMLGGVLMVIENPQDRILAEQRLVQERLADVADNINELKETIAKDETLTPEERQRLEQRLAELEERLRQNPGNREDALADMSATEAQLRANLDPQSDARRAALEQMARNLESLSDRQPLERPDLNRAAEALNELAEALEQMTEEERQALADRLAQQASDLAASDSRTSQNLSDAANALNEGDMQQAAEHLQAAAESVETARGELADQQATQRSLSEIQEGRQQVAQAGQLAQAEPGQPSDGDTAILQPGQPGESNQAAAQPGQSGANNQSGQQPGSGGGSNAQNLGQGQSNSNSNVNPNQPGQGWGNTRAQNDTVYQPYRPSGEAGERTRIRGEQGEGGRTETSSGHTPLPGVSNPSLVPYRDVYPEYAESASQALDRGYIPPHLKNYVRDYFSELEPGN